MSNLKEFAKRYLEGHGWYLRKTAGLAPGMDLFLDLGRVARDPIGTIFDVGAHRGETAVQYSRHFPHSSIFSFEPVAENFAHLTQAMSGFPNVRCIRSALGETEGTAEIELRENSQTHSLCGRAGGSAETPRRTEQVRVQTVDGFMGSERLERISLLKVDTEGFEIPVLRGASRALAEGRIEFLLLEATIDPTDASHTQLARIQEHLSPHGYCSAAIYDQCIVPDPTRLLFFNVLFARRHGGLKTPAAT
jgi:FkbM family methyltransferase